MQQVKRDGDFPNSSRQDIYVSCLENITNLNRIDLQAGASCFMRHR